MSALLSAQWHGAEEKIIRYPFATRAVQPLARPKAHLVQRQQPVYVVDSALQQALFAQRLAGGGRHISCSTAAVQTISRAVDCAEVCQHQRGGRALLCPEGVGSPNQGVLKPYLGAPGPLPNLPAPETESPAPAAAPPRPRPRRPPQVLQMQRAPRAPLLSSAARRCPPRCLRERRRPR